MLKLNFELITTQERANLVKNFFSENPSYRPGKHELTTITNYILYGKDPYIDKKGNYIPNLPVAKWTNMSSRKEIEIETKHSTWAKKKPSSLDEALESPAFNEAELLQPQIRTKAPRPYFDRELEKDIPTIKNLWDIIDQCSKKLENPEISKVEKYKLRHMLIELRRQQFTLRDIFKPTMQKSVHANHSVHFPTVCDLEIDWESKDAKCAFAPMGLYHKGDLRFEDPLALANEIDNWGYNHKAERIIDFSLLSHIDCLISFYEELKTAAHENFLSSQNAIIDTLNFYISKTKLTKPQIDIIEYKKRRFSNKEIAKIINLEYNKTYSDNYISTIYQKSCGHVADTAKKIFNYYTERINPFAFKKCSVCGQLKLRNADEFMRKARNSDGFSSKCKECENNGKK